MGIAEAREKGVFMNRKWVVIFFVGLPVFFLNASFLFAAGPTYHPGGTLTGDVTWTLDGSPYIVQSDITISGYRIYDSVTKTYSYFDSSLAIEAGVVVKFGSGVSIRELRTIFSDTLGNHEVVGQLISGGTSGNRVLFTSWRDNDQSAGGDTDGEVPNVPPAAGNWESVQIVLDSTIIHDCVFRYGGGNGSSTSSSSTRGALRVYGASPEVRDNVFEHNYFGIELYDSSSVVNNNTVTGSTYNPVIQVATSFPSYNGNTYTGNGRQAIRVAGRIDGNGTWDKDENLPFYIETAHSFEQLCIWC